MPDPKSPTSGRALWFKNPGRLNGLVLVFSLAFVGLISALSPNFLALVNERGAGLAWRASDPAQIERRFVLVDIDEKSLAEMGPWPWPRERMAELVRALDQHQVGLKLFDVVFPESRAGDTALAEVMNRSDEGPNVVAQAFSLDPSNTNRVGTLVGSLPLTVCPPVAARGYGYLANGLPVARAGHITPRIDPDGAVRRVPAMVCLDGRTYPTLVLAGLSQMADGAGTITLSSAESLLAAPWTLSFPGLPGVRIPMSDQGDLRVSYKLPREAFISISAADVWANRVPSDLLSQSWVIVGATAFGLADTVPTPLGGAVSGLEVHAQLLSAILDDRLPYTPRFALLLPWVFGIAAAFFLLWIARLSSFRLGRSRAVGLPLVGVGLVLAVFCIHVFLLLQWHWFVPWSELGFFILMASAGLAMASHARSRFEAGRIFQHLSSHVSSPIASQLLLGDNNDEIVAKRQELTVLFVDIRNFSAFSERCDSDLVARVLHDFFSTVTRVVESHGGVVQHMVGDSVLAVWNGPQSCPDHAHQAVNAARDLWTECSAQLPELTAHGLEPLDIGIGLETGLATIGLFGPRNRRTHTVLGESVSVAVQLQALTADLASPVLAGETIVGRVSGDWKPLGYFLLPGLTRSRRVYSLTVLSVAQQQHRLKQLNFQRNTAA